MNYYPHHIGDFNNATRYLTRVERSVYRDAIEMYYDTEQPLTSDIDELAKKLICRTSEEKDALNLILKDFFTLEDGVYRNARCDIEIEKYTSNVEAKARAGKASARARKVKREQNSTRVKHVSNGCATNQEPEPITNKENDRSEDQSLTPELIEKGFLHFWKVWKEEKSKLGKVDTSPKGQTFEKKWKPYFKTVKTTDDFRAKVNQICDFVIASHRVEGFNRFENMQTGKFFSEKQWEDQ